MTVNAFLESNYTLFTASFARFSVSASRVARLAAATECAVFRCMRQVRMECRMDDG
jgi:hypothetical protein